MKDKLATEASAKKQQKEATPEKITPVEENKPEQVKAVGILEAKALK